MAAEAQMHSESFMLVTESWIASALVTGLTSNNIFSGLSFHNQDAWRS